MSKLIDADALGIGKANRDVFDDPKYADGWNNAIEIIESAPSVDAVEVVRCKDCKHRREFAGNHTEICTCSEWGNDMLIMHPDEFFCQYGERRSEDG
jgi:hypothetical protein